MDKILRVPPSGTVVSVIDFVNQMFTQAIRLQASDIHIECYRSSARLRYRLDGVLKEVQTGNFLAAEYSGITTRIKVLSELDIAEHRLPQDGRFSFSCEYGEVDVRVSILPAISGARMVLRIMDNGDVGTDFSMLGMDCAQVDSVRDILNTNQGMVLVTGPTGSGKTTTLYTMLNVLNQETANVLTVENPVEKQVAGVGQVQVCEDIGLDFSQVLRSFLRQDPEVIMVGEIRDFETADIAVKAALTGHLVLSTLHTGDTLTSIARLTSLGLSAELVSVAVSLIVSQRLVRLVCTNCKVRDEFVEGIPEFLCSDGKTELMRGSGCKECAYTGCRGRRGIFEVLVVDEQLRRMINRREIIVSAARDIIPGKTLEQSLRCLLLSGQISFGEYQRTLPSSDSVAKRA